MEPERPIEQQAEEWAAGERRRREEWLKGPTDEEKAAWMRERGETRAAGAPFPEPIGQSDEERELLELARRLARGAELVGKGSVYAFARAPLAAFSYLIRAGRAFDDELANPPRKGRVPF